MYGEAEEGALLAKRGLQPGQALVLTKALGTGVLLAADARGCAVGRHVAGTPCLGVVAWPVTQEPGLGIRVAEALSTYVQSQ